MNMGKSSVIALFTDGLRNICPYSFELHATNRQEVASCMPAFRISKTPRCEATKKKIRILCMCNRPTDMMSCVAHAY